MSVYYVFPLTPLSQQNKVQCLLLCSGITIVSNHRLSRLHYPSWRIFRMKDCEICFLCIFKIISKFHFRGIGITQGLKCSTLFILEAWLCMWLAEFFHKFVSQHKVQPHLNSFSSKDASFQGWRYGKILKQKLRNKLNISLNCLLLAQLLHSILFQWILDLATDLKWIALLSIAIIYWNYIADLMC